MVTTRFDIDNENQWCPGCGNFSILEAMKKAFISLEFKPEDLLLISGIGQAGKTPYFMECNMFNGLHGRALAIAAGAKTANHNLNIIVNSGDGDCYSEGANHFLAAIRRNLDITLLVHNNRIYGLTKGQASPTSSFGMKTKMQKSGNVSSSFNPIATALVSGAGFIARGFSDDIDQLSYLIEKAVKYKGFSMIDICQPCVSFNKFNTRSWYKKRIFRLDENYDDKGLKHDPHDYYRALKLAHMGEDKIPTGIIYLKPGIAFHERIEVLKEKPLCEYDFAEAQINRIINNL